MYDMSALYQAESVQDAIRLRLEHPEAQIIAGGTDVLVQMREGKRAGKALISILGCGEMRGVTLDEEEAHQCLRHQGFGRAPGLLRCARHPQRHLQCHRRGHRSGPHHPPRPLPALHGRGPDPGLRRKYRYV